MDCSFVWIILSVARRAFKLPTYFQLSFRAKLLPSLNLLSLICTSVSWTTFKISLWNDYILGIFNSLSSGSRLFSIMRSCIAWLTLEFSLSNMQLALFSNDLISLSRMRYIIAIVCTTILKFPLRHNFVISKYYFTLPLYPLPWIVINICGKTFKFTS